MSKQYKKDIIYFHLPGIIENLDLNNALFTRMQEHPDHFYDNVEIGSVFGCFPSSMWNGGRVSRGYIEKQYIPRTFTYFNQLEIPVRLTWTNPTLTEEDVQDKMCNYITAVGENGFNEVLVNTDFMENFMRKEYSLYPIISSTTKRINNIDALNAELEKDYHIVVVDYDFNNKWELLEQINKPEKCEILINPVCNPNCPYRKAHYEYVGHKQKDPDYPQPKFEEQCMAMSHMHHETKQLANFVSVEDIYNKYVPKGFQHFKIEGRMTNPFKLLHWYVYYLVKPEYAEVERDYLLRGIENGMFDPMVPFYKEEPNIS